MDDWQYKPAADLGLPPTERWRSLRREAGLGSFVAHHAWWIVARMYLGLAHRLTIRGVNHLPPRPPYILVANHASHLDALTLAAALPMRLRERVFPIAAGDTFFETPVASAFAAMMLNALPLWRRRAGRHALQQLRRRLIEEQCVFILFPEGTRTRTGRMDAFKPGIGMLLAGADIPAVPCHLQGTFDALPPHRRVPRLARLKLTIGPALNFAGTEDRRAGWDAISTQLQAAVEALGRS